MNYDRVNYYYEGIMGYDFFKKLRKNEKLFKEIMFDDVIDPNITSRCMHFLASIFFNKNPWGVLTVKTIGNYGDIEDIIDGRKRLQFLSQVFLETDERRTDYNIFYSPIINAFVSSGYDGIKYPLYDIYNTFKMISIYKEIEESDKYTPEQKKIIHDNFNEFNSFWQGLKFEICWYNDDYEKKVNTNVTMMRLDLNKSINNE